MAYNGGIDGNKKGESGKQLTAKLEDGSGRPEEVGVAQIRRRAMAVVAEAEGIGGRRRDGSLGSIRWRSRSSGGERISWTRS